MEAQNFRFDDSGLRNLLKALEGDHVVRVGIFGSMHTPKRRVAGAKKGYSDTGRLGSRKVGKTSAGMTNAEVGFKTEYGDPQKHIPARSWLRMPIITKINDIAKDSAKFFSEAAQTGDLIKFLTVLGINTEKWIQLAFDTRGFGSWAANSPRTIALKGSDAPNIDTAQLRRSVTSMVI